MLKLAALGAIGFFGFKYFRKDSENGRLGDDAGSGNAVAGGPLSDRATVQPRTPG